MPKIRITKIIAQSDGITQMECTDGKNDFVAFGSLYLPAEKQSWNVEWVQNGDTYTINKASRTVWDRMESEDILRKECSVNKNAIPELLEKYGDDIFNMNPDEAGLLKIKYISYKSAASVLEFIKKSRAEYDAWEILSIFKPYQGVLSYIKKNEKNALASFNKNPYVLLEYGIGFYMVDSYALDNGIDAWDDKRCEAVMRTVIRRMHDGGHTRLQVERFLQTASEMTARDENGETMIPQDVFNMLLPYEKDVKLYEDNGVTYVEPVHDILCEAGIALHLKRLEASKKPIAGAVLLNTDTYTKEQMLAFNILNGGVKILTGGPGTGKTTVIGGIVKALPDSAKILLCAPTGRATARMTETSGMTAKTIHKALNLKWFLDNQAAELNYDLIIADEMSMCETELLYLFLKAIRSGTALLLSGDYNQLPSVGPGQVFRDLIESGTVSTIRLTKVMRQSETNGIVTAANDILSGNVPKPNENVSVLEMDEAGIREYVKTCEGQCMVPVKKGQCGTFALNNIIQKTRKFNGPTVYLNGFAFHEGDVVIMNENRYDIGFMNGDIGTIQKISGNVFSIMFHELLDINIGDLDGMLPAYALTVHKSQGAECDEAVIILPKSAKNMASRQLIYTALTRAKKKATIIEERGMLRKYVEAERKTVRFTGLKMQLMQGGVRI